MLMRICCFLAPPELGELGKPGSLARRLALGRPLALLCGLVRGIIRLIIVNCIRVAVPMTGQFNKLNQLCWIISHNIREAQGRLSQRRQV